MPKNKMKPFDLSIVRKLFPLPSISVFCFFCVVISNAQDKKTQTYGYIKELYMFYHPSHPIQISETNTIENLSSNILHNRLNFRWYATDNLTIAIEARNRIFSGQIVKQYPGYKNIIDYDNGFFDLSKNVINNNK